MRSALVWLGKADPVKSIDTAHADDPERISLAELHREWAKLFGTGEAFLKEVVDACEKRTVVHHGSPFPVRVRSLRAADRSSRRLRERTPAGRHTLSYWIRTREEPDRGWNVVRPQGRHAREMVGARKQGELPTR